jgi:hypothetical protein
VSKDETLSRRQIAKSFRSLRSEIVADVEKIVLREMSRLEGVASTTTSSSSQAEDHTPASAPVPVSAENVRSDQAGAVVITQELGKTLYKLVEDALSLGRTGKMRAFDLKGQDIEALIVEIDNSLLSQVNLTGEPTPTN